MELRLEQEAGSNTYTISEVDSEGNGIIIIRGQLGACDFLNVAEVEPRIRILSLMVATYNEYVN